MSHVRAGVPPCFVVHGALDTLAPVEEARHFVGLLRAVSTEPVAYAELPGAHHAFDVFPSIRSLLAVDRIEALRERGPSVRTSCARGRINRWPMPAGRRPIRRPRRVRSHHQSGQGEQHRVVVHPPAREVAPRLLAIGLQRHAGFGHALVDLDELRLASMRDRIVGRSDPGRTGCRRGRRSRATRDSRRGCRWRRRASTRVSSTASRSAAASSTAPEAVTHERFGFGERKNERMPVDVCVSSISTNHSSHACQSGSRRSANPVRCARMIISGRRRRRSGADGELTHRDLAPRERRVDRRQVRDQHREQPEAERGFEEASRRSGPRWRGVSKPSVKSADPLSRNGLAPRTALDRPEDAGRTRTKMHATQMVGNKQHRDRRVERHDAVASLVAVRRARVNRSNTHPRRAAR